VPEEWEKHSYISLGGLSEKAMKRMYTEYPHIHSIYLCMDNDEPGNERCRQFVSLIPEELSVYRLEPVKKDWNECLVAEVPVENMAKQMCWRDDREKPVPVMKMSEVEETVVQWLWYPFIPFGKVTLIQGNPGKGKTWLAMAIAAYCTNGKELPNALPIEPFNVLYQTAEDGIADTIKPRLAKCGADMTRVRFINEDEKQLSMTDDRIEKAIRQNNVRLMIMDPIQAYLGANVDMNRANEIRPLFRHLSTIAERTGCAIVLIGHLNKSSGSQSDYRSLGSIDIAAAVRSILFVEKVEKEKEQDIRVVYQQKDSLAKKENPVAFSLGEEGLTWLGEYDISIEDLLMGKA
ncbi:toprim domain-containing protein, partial [gut metagenome]